MKNITYTAAHADEGVAKLIAQLRGKPRLEGLLRSYLDQIQDLEDFYFDLYVLRSVDSAEDQQLDDLGDLVGQKRNGMQDDEYRLFVKARILANKSKGYNPTLLKIIRILNATTPIKMREYYPKAVVYEVFAPDANPMITSRDLLQRAKASGVNLDYQASPQDYAHTLIGEWSGGGGLVTTTNQRGGWSGVTPVAGGVGEATYG